MQPVGAHDEVEAARGAVLERDADAVLGFLQRDDGVPEHVLDVVARRVVQDPRELAARDLDVAVVGDPRGERADVDLQRRAAGSFEDDDLVARSCVPDRGFQSHSRDDLHGWSEEVDGVTADAVPVLRRPLHDHRREAVVAQPMGEHRPSDPGAGNEDVRPNPHRSPSSRLVRRRTPSCGSPSADAWCDTAASSDTARQCALMPMS
jgi:hypothetical protein